MFNNIYILFSLFFIFILAENLKWISLFVLVFQNSLLVLTLRYSKTVSEKYVSSTAVVCSETIKFFSAMLIHVVQRVKETPPPNRYTFKMLLNELFGKESDCIKIMVPAVLYLIQNNLQYLAATKLDAATFQVTYQMKIITTAIFSVVILRRTLFTHQWISIVMLTLGIALVQFPTGGDSASSEYTYLDKMIGLIAVLTACVLSGLAGVYFEKILKKSKVTVWARNVQLALFSVIPGYLIGCQIMDGKEVRENGFFHGYSGWTWAAISCQAFGGILVAIVVKYADNILKGFATSISIILSCVASIFIFDFKVTLIFIIGCGLVIYATYLYGKPVKTNNNPVQEEANYTKLEENGEDEFEIDELNNIENASDGDNFQVLNVSKN